MQNNATTLKIMPEYDQLATLKEETWWKVNSIASALVAMGQRPNDVLLHKHFETIEPLFTEYMEWLFAHQAESSWVAQVKKDDIALSKARSERPTDCIFEVPQTLYHCNTKTIALYKYYKEHPKLHNVTGNQLINNVFNHNAFASTDYQSVP